MVNYKQREPSLRSWSCKGCTNVCYLEVNGEVFKYCKPTVEGRVRHEWVTDTFIDCLDKTNDPSATDNTVKVHPNILKARKGEE